jgi:hypothetical protein
LFVAGAILTALILRGGRLQDGDTAREAVSDSPRIV